jgi:hypothetical protein
MSAVAEVFRIDPACPAPHNIGTTDFGGSDATGNTFPRV